MTGARKANQRPALPRRVPTADRIRGQNAPKFATPSPIAQLAAALAEVQHDLRQLAERVDGLCAPQRPPSDYVPLKVAAAVLGFSIETMRMRAVHREVDARRVGGKWFVKVRQNTESAAVSAA
jgi:hypothetical protein